MCSSYNHFCAKIQTQKFQKRGTDLYLKYVLDYIKIEIRMNAILKYPNSLNVLSKLNVCIKNIFWAFKSLTHVVVVLIITRIRFNNNKQCSQIMSDEYGYQLQ